MIPLPSDICTLVERTRSGDEDGFALLVSRFHDSIYALLRRLLRCEEDARDVAQETFLEAYRTLDRLRTPAAFPAWIRRIATSRAYSRLRYRQSHPGVREGDEGMDTFENAATEFPEVDRHELRGLILRAISRIPEPYGMALMLHHLEHLSPQIISQELGMNANTVRVTLHRGFDYLRETLQEVLRERESRALFAI